MSRLNRREFLKLAGLASMMAMLPRAVSAATTAPRVVVCGGGFGGATVAKYIRMWGGNVDVTLVEPNASHISCILSNLVVTGQISMGRINIGYSSLVQKHGVNLVQGKAIDIDPNGRTVGVETKDGIIDLPYDHLVLAPGIDFMPAAGNWNPQLTPHAWQAGTQTTLLKNQLASVPNNGTFVMTVPKAPYRCPPGPYERACVVADYLKRKRRNTKVIVLDANPGITAEPEGFGRAFKQTYAGIIQYIPNANVTEIDSAAKRIVTSAGTFSGHVLNYIPNQKAGKLVVDAGLANDATGRWAAVDPLTYGSTLYPEIHVIGDSQATGQPKSGHMANAQAKVCADAIVRALNGEAPDPNPVTASACYSPISSKSASWLTVNYQYNSQTGLMQRVESSFGEAPSANGDNFEDMFTWAESMFADSFA